LHKMSNKPLRVAESQSAPPMARMTSSVV
jgi:hypothetical protein